MAVFSRYARVVEADGSSMRVRAALGLINQALDEVSGRSRRASSTPTHAGQWPGSSSMAFSQGAFGDAETLSKAKVTSIDRLVEEGIVAARAGQVRLLRPGGAGRRPSRDDPRHASVWAVTQRLIHALETAGEEATARLLAEAGGDAERGSGPCLPSLRLCGAARLGRRRPCVQRAGDRLAGADPTGGRPAWPGAGNDAVRSR